MTNQNSAILFKKLVNKLLTNPDSCDYNMTHILALAKDTYQKDLQVNSGAILYFLMQQFVFEDQDNFIKYAKAFASVDDITLLEMLSGKISKTQLADIIHKGHLKHYLEYINEASKQAIYDESLYALIYIPCYFINNEIKYVHVRGEANAGLVCTFVSLDHANGFCKDFKTAYEHAIDFYNYNLAGNTPIAANLEHFFIKPIMIKKADFDNIEIFQAAN